MVVNDFNEKEMMRLEIIIQEIFCRLQSIALDERKHFD
jgi:hypothetical protein